MSNLTLGSLFDGSGGFPLGGMLCGITPVWASEIEPFPIRVTTKRLPFMKHYGDVSKINGADLEPVDIITFGSPCTDMSVAGKRAGLDGQQSVLFYQAIRIVKEMRCATNGKYPRWICWENVFGAFSSSGGADFKAVLEAVIGVVQPETEMPAPAGGKWPYADIYMGDGWSVAYRTVDAQFFGVPQRRRRIYLVADFAGECAGEVLFERQGVSRDYPTCGDPRQGAAADAENGAGAAGFGVDGYNSSVSDKAATLGVNCGMSTGRNGVAVNDRIASTLFAAYGTKWNGNEGAYSGGNFIFDSPYVLNDQGGQRMDVSADKSATLRAEAHHPPCVMQSSGFCTEHSAKSRSVGYEEERSPTLRAGVVPGVAIENHPTDGRCKVSEDGKVQTLTSRMGTGGMNTPLVLDTPKTLKIRSGCEGGGKGALIQEDMSATLSCNNDQTVFVPTAYGICSDKSNSMLSGNPHSGIYEADTSRTLDANGGNPGCNQGGIAVVEPVAFAQNQRDEVRDLHGKSGAIPAQPGMKQQTYVLQGSMIGREDKNGPQGDGVDEDVSFTLNTIDRLSGCLDNRSNPEG
jgi:DNA (cytosine-5)-methyltransferase 1